MERIRNWAGNYTYGTTDLHVPESMEQVQKLIVDSSRIKVLGTRHSFNGIADSNDRLLSLEKLNRVIELDRKQSRVTVEAGIRCGDLAAYLHANGYALHNLASLPHITVVGACATATHGSGDRNANLAAAVHALEIVKANGEIVVISRDDGTGRIDGAAVGLGALGVVTKLTLDIIPDFQVSQHVYENLPLASLEDHFDEIFSSGYSVSLFTQWKDSRFHQVWQKRKHENDALPTAESDFYGAKPSSVRLHPLPNMPADNCSEQLGIPGPSHERLPHFRMAFTPSAGEELQSEYFVAREDAYAALRALDRISESISPHLYVSEVRTIAQDRLWLSPCYMRESVGIHFTWKPNWEAVRHVLPLIERQLAPFGARPHWGKLFTMSPSQVQALYEKLPDFRSMMLSFDPDGKFRNTFLNDFIVNG
ncbi:FAD-binding protein [Paenibacillus sp.]|uniref:FAD-binding protein n=1 Tax=Paenibacillus sp. TaxID=58172 RepID=UPI002D6AA156|nr:FAD-binding protein [Paenibacillus sp.]HZG84352.1 FAD-binding protein [Paenibacillus sp.]